MQLLTVTLVLCLSRGSSDCLDRASIVWWGLSKVCITTGLWATPACAVGLPASRKDEQSYNRQGAQVQPCVLLQPQSVLLTLYVLSLMNTFSCFSHSWWMPLSLPLLLQSAVCTGHSATCSWEFGGLHEDMFAVGENPSLSKQKPISRRTHLWAHKLPFKLK